MRLFTDHPEAGLKRWRTGLWRHGSGSWKIDGKVVAAPVVQARLKVRELPIAGEFTPEQ